MVDSRSTISNVEKLYYLLSYLGLKAAEVIEGFTVSNDSYVLAWGALVERLDKPRRLTFSILESMLSNNY